MIIIYIKINLGGGHMGRFNSAEIYRNGSITMLIAKAEKSIDTVNTDFGVRNDMAYMLFHKFDYNKPNIPERFLAQLFELKSFIVVDNKVLITYRIKNGILELYKRGYINEKFR